MNLRKKLVAASALLLVCAILLVSVSYAWLTISRVPEISGIDTNIGANGSLEIALLDDTTYVDPTLIRAKIGDSVVAQGATASNLSWGNVIDLSDESYGLNEISILPSRLNVRQDAEGNPVVGSNILIFPRYGIDGRSSDFYRDSVSAVYGTDGFIYSTAQQSYGVRAIGTTSQMSVQQAALANARSQVFSYTSAANSTAVSAWKANGKAFLDIYIRHYYLGDETFTKSDVAVIRDMAVRMRNAVNYVDLALRQGLVGYAASTVDNEDTFQYVRAMLEDSHVALSETLQYLFEYGESMFEFPAQYSGWADIIAYDSRTLASVIDNCDSVIYSNDSDVSWHQFEWELSAVMDAGQVYWNDSPLAQMEYVLEDNVLTLTEDAGPMVHIADFTGNYSTFVAYLDEANVEVTTLSSVHPPRLVQISGVLEGLQAAAGDEALAGVPLEDIYGYTVDLAFRCNQLTNLLLQTTPESRIQGTDDVYETQGSGSYLKLNSEQLGEEQILRVMDAIRVGFLDNQNRLIALAKCTSHTTGDNWAEGSLYLHEFSVAADGSISVGAPRKEAPAITTLTGDVPTVITAVVWMDGDYVDNSMAAISGKSMTGVCNLQFASSVALNPTLSGGIGSTITPPESGGSDEPAPDTPVAPDPSVPTEQTEFYLEQDGGNQYSFYTLSADGSRDYEMTFTGSMDAESGSVVVEDVTAYPAEGVVIPALATYAANDEACAVSIDPTEPFANLGTESASVSFVAVNGEKVGITSTVLSNMFNCNAGTDFAVLDLSGLDTSGATNMSYMFRNRANLAKLDLSGFDTSNVTGMTSMFSGCSNLTEIAVSGFETSNVIGMGKMFYSCTNLTELDVSGFDTTNVTDMSYMFCNCGGLTELDVDGFNTANVTDMSFMFASSSLTKLDVSEFDTSKVTRMNDMFGSCSGLTELDLSGFDTSRVTDTDLMLYNCSSLQTVVSPKAMGDAAIDLPGSYLCQANGSTYTVIDQTVPMQAVLVKQQ